MIQIIQHGNFKKTKSNFQRILEFVDLSWLDRYGKIGVEALKANTPKDTGLLADSWYYEIKHDKNGTSLIWCNDDIEGGAPIAIIIQYGHATKNGKFVEGVDYINPALKPIFDKIAEEIGKEFKR